MEVCGIQDTETTIEAKDELGKVLKQTAQAFRTLCISEVEALRLSGTIHDEYMKAKNLKRKHKDFTKVIEDEKMVEDCHGAFVTLHPRNWEYESMGKPAFIQQAVRGLTSGIQQVMFQNIGKEIQRNKVTPNTPKSTILTQSIIHI